ncbi:MAG TPA: DUF1272 domain-containing protein, partial [Noviherbaspirillum sp.]|nr:DUF1272 domain-containing protein [Noviherbaspirillum sp.]
VCPNCGGGFVPRPVRPQRDLKNCNNVAGYPPAERIVYKPVDVEAHKAFAAAIRQTPPHLR